MITIIIPAHNEEAVIGRCLTAMTTGAPPGAMDVIVACNGCKDRTATVARSLGAPVRVLETDVASKYNALNLGDSAATGFPRFYVDADVEISYDSIRKVAACLESGQALAAAPRIAFDLAGCSWAVRRFYDVWRRLPYLQRGMIGSGVFALSQAGRARFDKFPPITADDAFARLQFSAHERAIIEDASFTIHPPRTFEKLVAIKTRAHFGNLELRARFPELWKNEEAAHGSGLGRLVLNPLRWPAIAVYTLVRLLSRRRGKKRWLTGNHRVWERDETSRQALPAGGS